MQSYVTRILHIGRRTCIGHLSDTDTRSIRHRYVSDTPADVSACVAYLYLTTVADMLLKATDMDGSARYGWDTSKPRFCISSTPLHSKVKTKKNKTRRLLSLDASQRLSPLASPPSPIGLRDNVGKEEYDMTCHEISLTRTTPTGKCSKKE